MQKKRMERRGKETSSKGQTNMRGRENWAKMCWSENKSEADWERPAERNRQTDQRRSRGRWMRHLSALSCFWFFFFLSDKQWRMMDEIKRETSDGERPASLQAPNKEVMSYYTPVSHQHPLQWVSLCVQCVFVCVQPGRCCGCSKCQLIFEHRWKIVLPAEITKGKKKKKKDICFSLCISKWSVRTLCIPASVCVSSLRLSIGPITVAGW